jgi:hypothetical protein
MRQLPSGLRVFNAMPHPITLWQQGWRDAVSVESHGVIHATPTEVVVDASQFPNLPHSAGVGFVVTEFRPTDEGWEIIRRARESGADIIIASMIATLAYPGHVVAMTPVPGRERVKGRDKMMNANRFTAVFQGMPLVVTTGPDTGP